MSLKYLFLFCVAQNKYKPYTVGLEGHNGEYMSEFSFSSEL